MNREMLKECIADAKTIRETAIASAKVALEEAFTPQLTAMFAERLNELELEEAETEKESIDEMYGAELEEDFNLEEILAELSMEEGNEDSKMKEEGMEQELEEDLMLEDMSDEEIEALVMQVIDDMIASGKLMPGEGEEEGEEEEMEDMEDMDTEEIDEEINLEELLAEMDSDEEKPVKENEQLNEAVDLEVAANQIEQYIATGSFGMIVLVVVGVVIAGGSLKALYDLLKEKGTLSKLMAKDTISKIKDKIPAFLPSKLKSTVDQFFTNKEEPMEEATTTEMEKATPTEMEETINELRKELNEVNLLNAKLLYTNKIFKSKNLTESEKIKVLNTFDKAETVKEVKLVFETLTESLKATTAKKNPIKESLGSASKTIGTATPKQPIIEANEAFARMQRLAGLKK